MGRGHAAHGSAAGIRAPVLRVRVGFAALPVGDPHAHRRARPRASRFSTTCGTRSTARTTTPSCGCASPRASACRRDGRPRRPIATRRRRRWSTLRRAPSKSAPSPRRLPPCTHTSARCRRSPAPRSTACRSTTASTTSARPGFFAVHGVMDIEHSGAEREMLGAARRGRTTNRADRGRHATRARGLVELPQRGRPASDGGCCRVATGVQSRQKHERRASCPAF